MAAHGAMGDPHDVTTVPVTEAAALDVDEVQRRLASPNDGLSDAEAAARLRAVGANAVRSHGSGALAVLLRQLRSPLLVLLGLAAVASAFVGERTDTAVIGAILALSVGLGFVNDYRAEKAAAALHDQIRHSAIAVREGRARSVDVTQVVPGDVVELRLGEVVPADMRLTDVVGLECDETVLTGESLSRAKQVAPVPTGLALGDLASCALMGTVVQGGTGRGVVVATGAATEFGRIAVGLGERHAETDFQVGLRRFSLLLVRVASVLTAFVVVANVALRRPVLDAVLFALAIAVGITPQLLPAVVSTSLAAGARQLSRRKVLVKRLMCIEDLGNIQVLFTDKTGTLTEGRISLQSALDPAGKHAERTHLLGLLCNEATVQGGRAVGGNAMDVALWEDPRAEALQEEVAEYRRRGQLPFDHERQIASVVVARHGQADVLVTKGAPEAVLARCSDVPREAPATVDRLFAAGGRVVAVAERPWTGGDVLEAADEKGLRMVGILVFRDAPRESARTALEQLRGLGITIKIVTGDNPVVARTVCESLGLAVSGVLTGADLEHLDDAALAGGLDHTEVFARVSPEQKARIVRAQRRQGVDVAFLGDGVNDAVALHAADVGISVESAADVAKDAADVILLEKDLNVLAGGVVQGRRTFANTIKYVLMGTSSNFGNMVSAAVASAVLKFLPMLPSQILLNNLLYDLSQLSIPTDRVDEEQLARPAHWDIGMIQRYMLAFGPLSSVFDGATFALMLVAFHAKAPLFRSGWFVESLATQALVILVIRTRRSPFFVSRPSAPLFVATLAVVLVGAVLPFTPVAHGLGFKPLPGLFFVALLGMVVVYLALAELVKRQLFRRTRPRRRVLPRRPQAQRRLHRRASRFSTSAPVQH